MPTNFTKLLEQPELARRYRKIKRFFHVREATYDVTSACQLRCNGCYYFEGGKNETKDIRNPDRWAALLEAERERGINYVILAGAEPALVPKVLRACYTTIQSGTVASNGLRRIDPDIGYRIHLSVWGDESGDPHYRRRVDGELGPACLSRQLENYRDDDRAIFVYTFNEDNIDQVDGVAERVVAAGHKLTFNTFSVPVDSSSSLRLRVQLSRTRAKMIELLERYPDNVLYSYYNAIVHTNEHSLHELFHCPYPRATRLFGGGETGLTRSFRSYRTDHSHSVESDCCVPDTDCGDCRHYAAGSAIVSSRLQLHVEDEAMFRGWLDYVDTYLAVWMRGYEKGENLLRADSVELSARHPITRTVGGGATLPVVY